MFVLFFVLTVLLEFYTALLIAFLIIKLLRKRELPWILVAVEFTAIVFFFYLKSLVESEKLIFIGEYADGSRDWGAGLANVSTHIWNPGILICIFLCPQIIFRALFFKKFREINGSTEKVDIKDFLNRIKNKAARI